MGAIYIANNIGNRANPWPTPMLAEKKRDVKLFQLYVVHLLERQLLKKVTTLELKPTR